MRPYQVLPGTRGYLHMESAGETQACRAGSSAWLAGACQDCTQLVLGTRHLNGAKGWGRTEGAAALERGDWVRGWRPRRGRARCRGYRIARMPGMDRTGGGFALSGCEVVGWLQICFWWYVTGVRMGRVETSEVPDHSLGVGGTVCLLIWGLHSGRKARRKSRPN